MLNHSINLNLGQGFPILKNLPYDTSGMQTGNCQNGVVVRRNVQCNNRRKVVDVEIKMKIREVVSSGGQKLGQGQGQRQQQMVYQHQQQQNVCHKKHQQLVQQQRAIVCRNMGGNIIVRQTPPNVQCMIEQAPPEIKKVTCDMCDRTLDENYVRKVMSLSVCKDCMCGMRNGEASQNQNCIIHNAGQNGFQDCNQSINLPQIGYRSTEESSEEEVKEENKFDGGSPLLSPRALAFNARGGNIVEF